MTEQELIIKISADVSDIKSKLDDVKNHTAQTTASMNSQFKQVAQQIGLAFGLAAIIAFGKKCEDAFSQAEQSALILDNTLKNIGVTDEQISKIEQYAEALSKAGTGFTGDEIKTALTNLTIKTGDANTAMQILGVAMQASRAKGEDLGTTVQQLSLGMLGNTRGLKDYGIVVTDTMTRQDVLNEIIKKTSGDMEKYMASTKGASDNLKVAYHDLKEEIGSQLAPIVSGFNIGLAKQIALLIGAGETSDYYKTHMVSAGTAIGSVFGGVITTLANVATIGISVDRILYDIVTFKTTDLNNEFITLHETLKNFGDIWSDVSDTMQGKNQETGKSFKEVMDGIEKDFGSTTDFLSKTVKVAADTSVQDAKDAAEKIKEQIQAISDKVQEHTQKSTDLKSRLTQFIKDQTQLEEDAQIQSIEKERDAKLSAIQDEMDARYDQYLSEIGLIDTEANSQISVLQKQLKQMADGREKQQHDNWLSEKRGEIARAKTSEERAKIQKEIDKELGNWQYENSRNGIQNQIELIRSQAEEDKKLAQDEYDADKKILDQKLKNWTNNYDLLLTNAKDYYANLLLERNAELKAEQILVSNSMESTLKILEDTESKWALLGTTIGDAFWGNLMGAIGDIKDLKNILSLAINLPGGSKVTPPEFIDGFQEGGSFSVSKPTIFMAGEAGTERVNITPQGKDESIPLLKDLLREMKKFNEITAHELGNQIGLKISGLGGKV